MLTLLAGLGGGLVRLLPEVFSWLNKKTDNAHELAMLDRQFQLEQTRAQARMDEIRYQGSVDETIALLDAQKSALQGQMQKTGIRWVDAINFTVRPVTTYFLLILYGLSKLAMFAASLISGGDLLSNTMLLYDNDDKAMLSSILAFYFVGRTIDRCK